MEKSEVTDVPALFPDGKRTLTGREIATEINRLAFAECKVQDNKECRRCVDLRKLEEKTFHPIETSIDLKVLDGIIDQIKETIEPQINAMGCKILLDNLKKAIKEKITKGG